MFLAFLLVNLSKELLIQRQINQKIDNLKKETAFLEENNSEIIGLMSQWQSKNQLEREARMKLGLKKPDEKVVILTNSGVGGNDQNKNIFNDVVRPVAGLERKGGDSFGNWFKWWQYFIVEE